jgi:hypothetical protein
MHRKPAGRLTTEFAEAPSDSTDLPKHLSRFTPKGRPTDAFSRCEARPWPQASGAPSSLSSSPRSQARPDRDHPLSGIRHSSHLDGSQPIKEEHKRKLPQPRRLRECRYLGCGDVQPSQIAVTGGRLALPSTSAVTLNVGIGPSLDSLTPSLRSWPLRPDDGA